MTLCSKPLLPSSVPNPWKIMTKDRWQSTFYFEVNNMCLKAGKRQHKLSLRKSQCSPSETLKNPMTWYKPFFPNITPLCCVIQSNWSSLSQHLTRKVPESPENSIETEFFWHHSRGHTIRYAFLPRCWQHDILFTQDTEPLQTHWNWNNTEQEVFCDLNFI